MAAAWHLGHSLIPWDQILRLNRVAILIVCRVTIELGVELSRAIRIYPVSEQLVHISAAASALPGLRAFDAATSFLVWLFSTGFRDCRTLALSTVGRARCSTGLSR